MKWRWRRQRSSELTRAKTLPPPWIPLLHLYVLSGFAIAQPLYDLLKGGAAFFIADGAEPADIWLVVAILSFVLPSIPVGIEALVSAFSTRGGRVVHAVLVVVLSALVFSVPLARHAELGTALHIGACLLAGGLLTIAYFRISAVRSFFTVLTPAWLLFPVLFVTSSSVADLVWPARLAGAESAGAARDVPIVFVVFDEMSSLHLLGRDGEIDAARFPGFARLARTSTWYRNARTVADGTIQALPAILTGTMTDPHWKLPAYGHFPGNLFTLLGGSHHMNIEETVTRLCPPNLCPAEARPAGSRRATLGLDLAIVYLHLIAPAALTAKLPVISQGWGGFAGAQDEWNGPEGWLKGAVSKLDRNRAAQFRAFLKRVSDAPHASLNFLHVLLPHMPLVYVPSGAAYGNFPVRDLVDERWGQDQWAIVQAGQRYLLQLQFVDRLVSELLDTLDGRGLLGDCMLVVTADHGVSFVPGDMRRGLGAGNRTEVARVPLFVKLPGQKSFGVSDIDATLVDILPTVAEVVGARPWWQVDGRSLLEPGRPAREADTGVFSWRGGRHQEVPPTDWAAFVRRHIDVYGDGSDPLSLFRIGPAGDIVGSPVGRVGEGAASSLQVEVDQATALASVKPSASVLPLLVSGTLRNADPTRVYELALALNDTIAATTRTYRDKDQVRFRAAIPQRMLRSGANSMIVFQLAHRADGNVRLRPCGGRSVGAQASTPAPRAGLP